jgi:diguanylate cyclase (GGDEF)-like protein/PAS domain S-box-containing protein
MTQITELMLGALPVAAAMIDRHGVVAADNPGSRAMFAGALAGLPVSTLFPSESAAWARLQAVAGAQQTIRLHGCRLNDVPFSLDARVSAADDAGRVLCIVREVRGRDLLDESRRYLDVAFESAPIGMALFNTDGQYERVNQALSALLGRGAEELLGRRDQEFTHPDDRAADLQAAERILRGDVHSHQTEKRFLRPDGSVVWAIANMTFLRDGDGRPLCWLGQFQDITQRKLDEGRLRHLADHDPLTGLANRRRLEEHLADRARHAMRYGERGGVLLLDLDGFKAINDSEGHAAGDAVLVTIARVLTRRLRATDMAARLGGDEFAVVLPHADREAAAAAADGLLTAIAEATSGRVTASCGIACYGPDAADGILSRADAAMYKVKRSRSLTGRAAFAPLPPQAAATLRPAAA